MSLVHLAQRLFKIVGQLELSQFYSHPQVAVHSFEETTEGIVTMGMAGHVWGDMAEKLEKVGYFEKLSYPEHEAHSADEIVDRLKSDDWKNELEIAYLNREDDVIIFDPEQHSAEDLTAKVAAIRMKQLQEIFDREG